MVAGPLRARILAWHAWHASEPTYGAGSGVVGSPMEYPSARFSASAAPSRSPFWSRARLMSQLASRSGPEARSFFSPAMA
jgi:hypothetical protein